MIPTLALATACIGPSRQEVLDPMVGQDVDIAIEAFGQPAKTVELGEGRRLYVWQRVYDYDVGRQSFDWPERSERWGLGWFEDDMETVDARVCSTGLVVGFDFVIESWDYACERVEMDRERARIRRIPSAREAYKRAL